MQRGCCVHKFFHWYCANLTGGLRFRAKVEVVDVVDKSCCFNTEIEHYKPIYTSVVECEY